MRCFLVPQCWIWVFFLKRMHVFLGSRITLWLSTPLISSPPFSGRLPYGHFDSTELTFSVCLFEDVHLHLQTSQSHKISSILAMFMFIPISSNGMRKFVTVSPHHNFFFPNLSSYSAHLVLESWDAARIFMLASSYTLPSTPMTDT